MATVAVIGGATGREHCLVKKLSRQNKVYAVLWDRHEPIKRICEKLAIVDLRAPDQVVSTLLEWRPDYVVVGQGEALFQGVAERLDRLSIRCVGPPSQLARIESSKKFSRTLICDLNREWSPRWKSFTQVGPSLYSYAKDLGSFVVKASGPVRNPRVQVFNEQPPDMPTLGRLATCWLETTSEILIEEYVEGKEVAVLSFFDGRSVLHSPPFQNYKRLLSGDRGELTSGMGAVAGFGLIDSDTRRTLARINEKVVGKLEEIVGKSYVGCLYGEFRITPNGAPKVLEFNCRFGNPSTLNVDALSEDGIESIIEAMAVGELGGSQWRWKEGWSFAAYAVPVGFTSDEPAVGELIDFSDCTPSRVFVGKVEFGEHGFRLLNSRAVAIAVNAESPELARDLLYSEMSRIKGPIHYRDDLSGSS